MKITLENFLIIILLKFFGKAPTEVFYALGLLTLRWNWVKVGGDGLERDRRATREAVQYNAIQILLSTPHGGFSETNINSTGDQKKNHKQTNNNNKKITQELSINNY